MRDGLSCAMGIRRMVRGSEVRGKLKSLRNCSAVADLVTLSPVASSSRVGRGERQQSDLARMIRIVRPDAEELVGDRETLARTNTSKAARWSVRDRLKQAVVKRFQKLEVSGPR